MGRVTPSPESYHTLAAARPRASTAPWAVGVHRPGLRASRVPPLAVLLAVLYQDNSFYSWVVGGLPYSA